MTYKKLAARRVATQWYSYRHPEDYGYHFEDLVSPYTRTAGNTDSDIVVVLQDWISHDGLVKRGFDPTIQYLGHDPNIQTNVRLKSLLRNYLDCSLDEIYATNLFPFIKPGGMSAAVPLRDLVRAASEFTIKEIEIVRPRTVLALGRLTAKALRTAGESVVELPHPAARISSIKMEAAWAEVFSRR